MISSKNSDECITYRSNLQCNGDIIAEFPTSPTKTSSHTFQAPEGYGRCASVCIGVVGAIAFNWISKGAPGENGSTCKCLRTVSS